MPANRRVKAELKMQTRLLPENPSWAELKRLANAWTSLLMDVALEEEPNEEPTGYGPAEHERAAFFKSDAPSPRQMRFMRYQDLQTIIRHANEAERGNPAITEQTKLKSANYLHSISMTLETFVEYDVDPIDYIPFEQSSFGRSKIAQIDTNAATTGNGFQEYMAKVSDMFRQYMAEHFAQSFPEQASASEAVIMNLRTLRAVAQDLAEAIPSTTSEQIGSAIYKTLKAAEKRNCFKLPEIEGVDTPEYWQTLVRNKFSDPVNLPSLDHLTGFTIQDRVPTRDVILALEKTANGLFPKDDLWLHYMTGKQEDKHKLLSLGRDNQNRVMVMGRHGENLGSPVFIQGLGNGFTNVLRVVAPGYQEKIIDTMEDGVGEMFKRLDYRTGAIDAAIAEMTRLTEDGTDQQVLQDLETDWQALIRKGENLTSDDVRRFQHQVFKAAEYLVTPALHNMAVSPEDCQENLNRWWSLARRSGLTNNSELNLKFGLPRHFGSSLSGQKPDAEIEIVSPSEVLVTKLDDQMNGIETVSLFHKAATTQRAIEVAKDWGAKFVGKRNKAMNIGMQIGTFNDKGELASIGHWISAAERKKLTVVPLAEVKKHVTECAHEKRTQQEVAKLQETVLSMLYQPDIHNPGTARDTAMIQSSYDWNVNGRLLYQGETGSPVEIKVSKEVLETEPLESIRRHLVVQIASSEIPHWEKKDLIASVQRQDMDKSSEKFEAILEELDYADNFERLECR